MTSIDLVTLAKGEGSRIVEPRRAVVRTGTEWRALWAAHAGPSLPAPEVDFATRMVCAAFAGERPTPGFDIEIVEARREGAALVLVVDSRRPDPRRIAPQIIMTPFHIVSLPRQDGEVAFVDGARRARPAPLTSSTGLDPAIAAALAYLVGPLSGAVILLAEHSSPYVRFHAWQSIIGLGGLWAIGFVLYLLAFLALFVSPTGFKVMLWLAGATWAVWVVVWIVCLVKAFSGELWKLPVAGKGAEKRIGEMEELRSGGMKN